MPAHMGWHAQNPAGKLTDVTSWDVPGGLETPIRTAERATSLAGRQTLTLAVMRLDSSPASDSFELLRNLRLTGGYRVLELAPGLADRDQSESRSALFGVALRF
jgi:hypothetical protein